MDSVQIRQKKEGWQRWREIQVESEVFRGIDGSVVFIKYRVSKSLSIMSRPVAYYPAQLAMSVIHKKT